MKKGDVAPYRVLVETIQDKNGASQLINRVKLSKELKDVGHSEAILDILTINRRKAAIFTDNFHIVHRNPNERNQS